MIIIDTISIVHDNSYLGGHVVGYFFTPHHANYDLIL